MRRLLTWPWRLLVGLSLRWLEWRYQRVRHMLDWDFHLLRNHLQDLDEDLASAEDRLWRELFDVQRELCGMEQGMLSALLALHKVSPAEVDATLEVMRQAGLERLVMEAELRLSTEGPSWQELTELQRADAYMEGGVRA